MKGLAQLFLFLIVGLGYASFIVAPLVLIMPFALKGHQPIKKCFVAFATGVVIVILCSFPIMYLLRTLFGPLLEYLDNSSGALDGTGLAFVLFFVGSGVTLSSLLAIWIERLILK